LGFLNSGIKDFSRKIKILAGKVKKMPGKSGFFLVLLVVILGV
jgi:hypothetical protein